ncbi:MAG TPA: DinB family protein [Vicinamibacteria bacterium]|nr:DinB family protein [Vicinamibacteria bacterium]
MKLADLLAAQVEREGPLSTRALERVPEGRADWKPHDKSMPLGYLATLVASIPEWIAMIVSQDSLDLKPASGQGFKPPDTSTRSKLLKAHEDAVGRARAALKGASEEHLMKPWQLKVAGKVVQENPRHVAIADSLMHLAHHRGQLTVYLRLLSEPVPAIYGPSADDARFS